MASTSAAALFGTLGMFIIDTFQYIDPATGQDLGDKGRGERIGGGGTYASIGARVWLSPHQVLMVVDRGVDFRPEWQATLDAYAKAGAGAGEGASASSPVHAPAPRHALWRYRDRTLSDPTGTDEPRSDLTTKALNVYTGEKRDFKYLTPRLRLNATDLALPLPAWIHCVCSPERVLEIASQVRAARTHTRTRICWEPLDMTATSSNLPAALEAMQHIDVFSPNHEEAAAFLSVDAQLIRVPSDDPKFTLEQAQECRDVHLGLLAQEFQSRYRDHAHAHAHAQTPAPLIVIRSGAAGSVALAHNDEFASVPSYHLVAGKTRDVKDVTGGGNAFLGGFVASLAAAAADDADHGDHGGADALSQDQLTRALVRGGVSASFAIEQLGLPVITHSADGQERWNGETAQQRLAAFEQ